MRKTLKQKIDESLLAMEQLQKRHDELMAQYNAQEQKARTHRLCERGGLVEKLLPELATLTKKQFERFVDKVLLTNYSRRVLGELNAENKTAAEPMDSDTSAQNGDNAAHKSAEAAAQATIAPPHKHTGAAQDGGTGGNASVGNTARQGG